MKLPGVQFIGVQSLGRESTSKPVAVAGRQASLANTQANVARQGLTAAKSIYEEEARWEYSQSVNKYRAAMDAWVREQQEAGAYDEDGNPKWDKASEYYKEAERKAREVATKDTKFGLSRRLFEAKANDLSLQYEDGWLKQNQLWKKSYLKSVALESFDTAYTAKDWTEAWNHNEAAFKDGLISAEAYVTNQKRVEQGIVYDNFDQAIEGSSASRILDIVDAIESNENLTDRNKQALINKALIQVRERHVSFINDRMSETFQAMGPAEALVRGRKILDEFRELQAEDYQRYGIRDAIHHQQVYNAMVGVFNNYRNEIAREGAGQVRLSRIKCVIDGTCPFTPENRDVVRAYEDLYVVAHGGMPKGKSDYENDAALMNPAAHLTGDGLIRTVRYIESTKRQYIPDSLIGAVDQALRAGGRDEKIGALTVLASFAETPRGYSVVRDSMARAGTGDGVTKQALSLMSVFKDPGVVADMLDRRAAMSSAEIKAYNDEFDAQVKEGKFLDKKFDDMVEDFFPADSWVPFLTTNPQVQVTLKREITRMAREYYPMTGDYEAAFKSAFSHMQQNGWGVTRATDKPRLMRYPPEYVVQDGMKDGGRWIREQLGEDFKKAEGADLPDTYNLQPVQGFDPQNPQYLVTWVDDETGRLMVSKNKYSFDYRLTRQWVEEEKNREIKRREAEAEQRAAMGNPSDISSVDALKIIGEQEVLEPASKAVGAAQDFLSEQMYRSGQLSDLWGRTISKGLEKAKNKIKEKAVDPVAETAEDVDKTAGFAAMTAYELWKRNRDEVVNRVKNLFGE